MTALGVRTQPTGDTCDLATPGAGPAGLTAAVWGAVADGFVHRYLAELE